MANTDPHTRADAERLVCLQLASQTPVCDLKGGQHHYGRMELMELLDFIYGDSDTRPLFLTHVTEEHAHGRHR